MMPLHLKRSAKIAAKAKMVAKAKIVAKAKMAVRGRRKKIINNSDLFETEPRGS
jgi:hypothetical protein